MNIKKYFFHYVLQDSSNKGSLKSSKAFFNKLQEEVVAEIHGVKKKKKKDKQLSGTQLKLWCSRGKELYQQNMDFYQ